MFLSIHGIYLQRCFDLARWGVGNTSPNPSVGAVIVYKNKIIGEGWTSKFGGNHAEVNAVASVSSDNRHFLSQSILFVSLEPCFHFGKTPPCVDLILREKIPQVVIAFSDPNPKVAGQSIAKLRANGVDVIFYNFNTRYNNNTSLSKKVSLKSFFTNVLRQTPYVILKWAESADGFIGKKDQRVSVSNPMAQRLVHKWRSECDAIMVGTNTAKIDNPALTNRLYFGKSPVRIVLDKDLKLPKDNLIWDKNAKTIVFTEGGVSENIHLNSVHIQIEYTAFNDNLLENILQKLMQQNIGILLVEGGSILLNAFIEKGLWNEAKIIKSPNLLRGDVSAPKLSAEHLIGNYNIGDNQICIYQK